jgi:ATP-dependent RNA helicase DeaD
MLSTIEKTTRQKIDRMKLPSTEVINNQRIARFKQRITDTLAAGNTEFFSGLMDQYCSEHNVPALDVAAALAGMLQGNKPLLLMDKPKKNEAAPEVRPHKEKSHTKRIFSKDTVEAGMERYRIEVGQDHGVKPANIVGAIINEAGLFSEHIGQIKIHDNYSTVDLPEGMPKAVFSLLKKVWVSGRQLEISRLDSGREDIRPHIKKRPNKTKKKGRRRKR